MAKKPPGGEKDDVLLKVLTAHFHALVAARSDASVLSQYSALLRFLKSEKGRFLKSNDKPNRLSNQTLLLPFLDQEKVQRGSLDDISRLISDKSISRKYLEYIAIQRFSVPRGSMRSFSSKEMLVDKLRTLIDNERTHETIGIIARGGSNMTPNS
jgi:hypothetical protein